VHAHQTMSTDSLQMHAHQTIFFSSVVNARECSHLTDVVISTGSKRFLAHKLMLSSFSGYFYRLFAKSSMNDHNYAISPNMDEVHLYDLDPLDFELLLHYIYHGEVNVPQSHLMDFLKTAQHFQIKGLSEDKLENSQDELFNQESTVDASKEQSPTNILKRKSSNSVNFQTKKARIGDVFSQGKKCLDTVTQMSVEEIERNKNARAPFIELKNEKEEKISAEEYNKLELAQEKLSVKCYDIQIEKNAVDMENNVLKKFIEIEEAKLHIRLQLNDLAVNVVKSVQNGSTPKGRPLQRSESENGMILNKENIQVEDCLNQQLMFQNINKEKSKLIEMLQKLERKSLRLARRNTMLGLYSFLSRKYNTILAGNLRLLGIDTK